VTTWKGAVYVAFVIDAFSRRIVGGRIPASPRSDLDLDALEQAICEREQERAGRLLHPGARGVQDLSTRCTERVAETGIGRSVGTRSSLSATFHRWSSGRRSTAALPIRPEW